MSPVTSELSAPRRHALGLPAGSVRSIHVFIVVGLFCAILLLPSPPVHPMPPYLVYLMFLILGHFFALQHAESASGGSTGLVYAGLIRILIIATLGGTLAYKITQDSAGLHEQFNRSLDALKAQPWLPLYVLGGFFMGTLVRMVLGRDRRSHVFQDLEAWTSIVALVLLLIAGVIHLVIAPSVHEQLSLPTWEGILAGVVAFYFGER